MMNIKWEDIRELTYEQICKAMMEFCYEPNNSMTWNMMKARVEGIIIPIVSRGLLHDAWVVCDSDLNTPDIVERNEVLLKVGKHVTQDDRLSITIFKLGPEGCSFTPIFS